MTSYRGDETVVLSGGNPFDPQAVLNAALIYGAARGRNAINERVAQQVARLLTSPNPQQVASRGPVFQALRNADRALVRVAGTTINQRQAQR